MTKTILRLRHGAIFGDQIELHYAHRQEDGRIAIAQPVLMSLLALDDPARHGFTEPLLRLDPDAAKQLMDELWTLGVRPTEGHGSTGQLAATEKHLNHITHILDQTLQVTVQAAKAATTPALPREPIQTDEKPNPQTGPLAVVLYKTPSGVHHLMLLYEAENLREAGLEIKEVQYLRDPTDTELNIITAQLEP